MRKLLLNPNLPSTKNSNLYVFNSFDLFYRKQDRQEKMLDLLFVSVYLGFLGLSSALFEPIQLPVDLQECYEHRSYNMTPSFAHALYIQNFCLRNFEYRQIANEKVWSGPNITIEEINYIDSLFRRILQEAKEVERQNKNGGRKKRQITRRYRREVRSPGAFQQFVGCITRLHNNVSFVGFF